MTLSERKKEKRVCIAYNSAFCFFNVVILYFCKSAAPLMDNMSLFLQVLNGNSINIYAKK